MGLGLGVRGGWGLGLGFEVYRGFGGFRVEVWGVWPRLP